MNLSFNGYVWVNPITTRCEWTGIESRTIIKSGKKMPWKTFLNKYRSGRLWEEGPYHVIRQKRILHRGFEELAIGAFVKPEISNSLPQPVTQDQVFILGPGLWQLRNRSAPTDRLWSYLLFSELNEERLFYPLDPNENEVENFVEELRYTPLELRPVKVDCDMKNVS